MVFEEKAKDRATMILRGKLYSCPNLKPRKNKGVPRDKKFEYDFDISKAENIFDHLIKEQQIWLKEGYKVPSPKELKGKKY